MSRLVKFSGKNGKRAAARCAFLMSVDKGESGKMLKQDESAGWNASERMVTGISMRSS